MLMSTVDPKCSTWPKCDTKRLLGRSWPNGFRYNSPWPQYYEITVVHVIDVPPAKWNNNGYLDLNFAAPSIVSYDWHLSPGVTEPNLFQLRDEEPIPPLRVWLQTRIVKPLEFLHSATRASIAYWVPNPSGISEYPARESLSFSLAGTIDPWAITYAADPRPDDWTLPF